jgi:hypothetical protein
MHVFFYSECSYKIIHFVSQRLCIYKDNQQYTLRVAPIILNLRSELSLTGHFHIPAALAFTYLPRYRWVATRNRPAHCRKKSNVYRKSNPSYRGYRPPIPTVLQWLFATQRGVRNDNVIPRMAHITHTQTSQIRFSLLRQLAES